MLAVNNPEKIGFFDKTISGRGILASSQLQSDSAVSAFTLEMEKDTKRGNVIAIAQHIKEVGIVSDAPLSVCNISSKSTPL